MLHDRQDVVFVHVKHAPQLFVGVHNLRIWVPKHKEHGLPRHY